MTPSLVIFIRTSMRVDLAIHGSLFRDIRFEANDLLKINNRANTTLINLHIILH